MVLVRPGRSSATTPSNMLATTTKNQTPLHCQLQRWLMRHADCLGHDILLLIVLLLLLFFFFAYFSPGRFVGDIPAHIKEVLKSTQWTRRAAFLHRPEITVTKMNERPSQFPHLNPSSLDAVQEAQDTIRTRYRCTYQLGSWRSNIEALLV